MNFDLLLMDLKLKTYLEQRSSVDDSEDQYFGGAQGSLDDDEEN